MTAESRRSLGMTAESRRSLGMTMRGLRALGMTVVRCAAGGCVSGTRLPDFA
jgi:hypothetical protein